METDKSEQTLQVAVRVRPLQATELGKEEVVYCTENSIRVSDENRFTRASYDAVFPPGTSQEDVYQFVAGLVPGLALGYNATVFAYGQTGSGKTFTMFGEGWSMEDLARLHQSSSSSLGIIPRVVSDLFQSQESQHFTTYCSFLEIYNEKIFDLLQDSDQAKPLQVREDAAFGLFVEGLAEYVVQSSRDSLLLLKRGERNRAIRVTKMNRNSSRSHCIFQLSMERDTANAGGLISRAKLNMCDLAGSEKYDRDREMQKQHLVEMNKINLSLTTLGKVIGCLAQGKVHIPYRDSKLTRLLMDSLGGNTRTYFIATVSPILDCLEETISTLNFSNRAKRIRQTVTKNEVSATDDKLVSKLQREIMRLKELLQLKKKGNAGKQEIQNRLWILTEENERLRAMSQVVSLQEVEHLKQENKRMRLELQKLYDSAGSNTPGESAREHRSETPNSRPNLRSREALISSLGESRQSPVQSEQTEAFQVKETMNSRSKSIQKAHSSLNMNQTQKLQFRVRGKNNLIFMKTTTLGDVMTRGKDANREKEALRRTQLRLQTLERLEAVQEERIRAEMRRVQDEQNKEEKMLKQRVTEEEKRRFYFESQKEKLKNYAEQKTRKQQAEIERKQTKLEQEKMKYKYRSVPPLLQPCLKPKPDRLEALLRESV